MLKFSKFLLLLYGVLVIVFISKHFLVTPLILLLLSVTLVSILITLIKIISSFRLREKRHSNILTLAILLLPIVVMFTKYQYEIHRKKVLYAYSDLVISSASIVFYDNNTMKYCTSSLLGEEYFYGSYNIIQDTFHVAYIGEKPSVDSKKMIRSGDKLLFLNNNDSVTYEFRVGY